MEPYLREEISRGVVEQFAALRDREINRLLSEYALTPENISRAGYVLVIERHGDREIAVLAKKVATAPLTALETSLPTQAQHACHEPAQFKEAL